MGVIETKVWTEKYRPKNLDALAMSEENRALIAGALEEEEIPHLLLHGPAGVGKTTLAYIIRDRLDCKEVVLNASKERGIDVIRDKVTAFARGMMGARWNLIILDEADSLTRDAQTALRNLMETYAERTRFVLTANYPHQIIDPLRSRCVEIEMARTSAGDRAKVLVSILEAEEISFEVEIVFAYAEYYTDLRRMINAAQRAFLTHGKLTPPTAEGDVGGEEVLAMISRGDWGEIVATSKTDGTDHQRLLIDMFWAVPDDHPQAATVRHTIAKAVHESGFTPDSIVHFLGTCAEMIA